jgi:hypothetical protein
MITPWTPGVPRIAGVVFTSGNSQTNTVGFKDTVTRRWDNASLRFKFEALRADTSDDWFEQVDPGFTWLPGETPPPVTSPLRYPSSAVQGSS